MDLSRKNVHFGREAFIGLLHVVARSSMVCSYNLVDCFGPFSCGHYRKHSSPSSPQVKPRTWISWAHWHGSMGTLGLSPVLSGRNLGGRCVHTAASPKLQGHPWASSTPNIAHCAGSLCLRGCAFARYRNPGFGGLCLEDLLRLGSQPTWPPANAEHHGRESEHTPALDTDDI